MEYRAENGEFELRNSSEMGMLAYCFSETPNMLHLLKQIQQKLLFVLKIILCIRCKE